MQLSLVTEPKPAQMRPRKFYWLLIFKVHLSCKEKKKTHQANKGQWKKYAWPNDTASLNWC